MWQNTLQCFPLTFDTLTADVEAVLTADFKDDALLRLTVQDRVLCITFLLWQGGDQEGPGGPRAHRGLVLLRGFPRQGTRSRRLWIEDTGDNKDEQIGLASENHTMRIVIVHLLGCLQRTDLLLGGLSVGVPVSIGPDELSSLDLQKTHRGSQNILHPSNKYYYYEQSSR